MQRLLFTSTKRAAACRIIVTKRSYQVWFGGSHSAVRGRCQPTAHSIGSLKALAPQIRCLISPSRPCMIHRYHIEASNAELEHTKLTVRGPDVDGILASMTVALAVKGCSLVSLNAASTNDVSHDKITMENDTSQVEDVFYVVKRGTGQPFEDDELENLAMALLESVRTPINTVCVKGAMVELEELDGNQKDQLLSPGQQISVIPSSK